MGEDAEAGAGGWLTVRAAVCATADARAACQLAHASLAAPGVPPSRELVEAPIWTTWARYFSGVTQAKVLKYAQEIVARGLPVIPPVPPLGDPPPSPDAGQGAQACAGDRRVRAAGDALHPP